jgi:hypothetical protein
MSRSIASSDRVPDASGPCRQFSACDRSTGKIESTGLAAPMRRHIVLLLMSTLLVLGAACGRTPANDDASRFDTSLVNEQKRRIASFDSVVRSVNTDSAYKLWHWTLTLPNPKIGQQQVECEYGRIEFQYGNAGSYAIRRMEDTVWRNVDGKALEHMRQGLRGESMPVNDALCGGLPEKQAPYWLRSWTVYPLPQLPPSATDSTPRP